ncbi:hypothetical protein SAMN05216524_101976 [Mucilaginibacter sp. OK098]|nr:hypothetical protein SAMN05216524_101976 [Mucilaginibacter sp. OK098]
MYFPKMKAKLQLLFIFFAIASIQSCSTVKIASNKDGKYTKQPKKIYIVVICDTKMSAFCNEMINGLQKRFTAKGINSGSSKRNTLSLATEDDLNKEMEPFKPEAILTIKQTVSGIEMGTFELTLTDAGTQKNVWKGELDVSADSYTSLKDSDVVNKTLNTLVNKLIEDKIIPN